MSQLQFPWLETSLVLLTLGALVVSRLRSVERARIGALILSGIALALTLAAWADFASQPGTASHSPLMQVSAFLGEDALVVDELNAPLMPLVALLYLLTLLTTLRSKIRRFSFAGALVSQALLIATFACHDPAGIIVLLIATTIPPYFELRWRHRPTGVYVLHMGLFAALLLLGGWLCYGSSAEGPVAAWRVLPLAAAIALRCGVVPVHCWLTDLFEHATFGTALLFVLPMPGIYAAMRLLLPIAPNWLLAAIGVVALVTAFYAAGMALVQKEARRFFGYLFLSHSALVLVGIETIEPTGLTGALCVWVSAAVALAGFGLTLRALECRDGRLTLTGYRGLYEQTPMLAMLFLLTGLASVGFPGTFGFVGTELLVDGVVHSFPYIGIGIVLVAALNGIAVVQTYFTLFTGTRNFFSISLGSRKRERFAVLLLAILILAGGIYPQPGVASRYQAAVDILQQREARLSAAASAEQHPRPETRGNRNHPARLTQQTSMTEAR